MSEDPVRGWELLRRARTIAVCARSDRTDRPWFTVSRYLIDVGFDVYLVNPLLDRAHGRPCYDRVQDLPVVPDIVDVFRRVPEVPGVVDDAIAAGAPAVWLQLEIVHAEAQQRALDAGLAVVANHCTAIEHRLLRAAGEGADA